MTQLNRKVEVVRVATDDGRVADFIVVTQEHGTSITTRWGEDVKRINRTQFETSSGERWHLVEWRTAAGPIGV